MGDYTRQELLEKVADDKDDDIYNEMYYRRDFIDILWEETIDDAKLPQAKSTIKTEEYAVAIMKACNGQCTMTDKTSYYHKDEDKSADDPRKWIHISVPGGEFDIYTDYGYRNRLETFFRPEDGLKSIDLKKCKAEGLAKLIVETYARHSDWYAEAWKDFIRDCDKYVAQRKINRTTLLTLMRERLKDAGIQVAAVNKPDCTLLLFDVGHASQAEIYVNIENYMDQIEPVAEAVLATKANMDKLGRGIYVTRDGDMWEWMKDE